MSDFEKKIRDQYNQEVKSEFETSQWDSYVTYRDQKKRKRQLVILSFIGVGLLGASYLLLPLYLTTNQSTSENIDRTELSDNPKTEPSTNEVISPALDDEKRTSEGIEGVSNIKVINESLSIQEASIAEIKPNYISRNISTRLTENRAEVIMDSQVSEITEMNTPSSRPLVTMEAIEKNNDILPQPRRIYPGFDISSLQPSDILWTNNLSLDVHPPMVAIQKIIPTPNILHHFYGRAFVGLSWPSHAKIADEQAHQYGVAIFYTLSKRWRIGISTEVANISYGSPSFEDRLGIPTVEAPNMDVDFAQAVVESISLTPTINIEYRWLDQVRWSSYLGAGYGFVTELNRDIDYEFEGDDNNSDDDDITIKGPGFEHYFVPNYIHLEGGVGYQLNHFGLNISIVVPMQLNDDKIDLLRQLNIYLGVTKSF